jgi:magnesium transporter
MTLGLHDMYMSHISNKMNEVMKVLTIIATIFIPLTFIAGVYGMNFNPEISPYNMPELNWYWGYPVIMTFMLVIGIAMVFISNAETGCDGLRVTRCVFAGYF